jgi:uncharacterized membrane protein (GlpM family)
MLSQFVPVVLIRAAAAAAVVVSASVLAEAAGPFWGGLIVSLPISAGPAYVMLGLQHDAAFIAASALGSLAANAVSILYMLAIILLAPRVRWPYAVAGALALWVVVAWLIRLTSWTLIGVCLLNIAVFAVALLVTRRVKPSGATAKPSRRTWFDLPMRALLVGSLTATVVTSSRWLGPALTGMAAVFPIALTGLALIVLPQLGGTASAALFASALRAMPGLGLALLVLHLTADRLGTWLGLLTAILAQLAYSAVLLLAHWRRAAYRVVALQQVRLATTLRGHADHDHTRIGVTHVSGFAQPDPREGEVVGDSVVIEAPRNHQPQHGEIDQDDA